MALLVLVLGNNCEFEDDDEDDESVASPDFNHTPRRLVDPPDVKV